MATASRRDGEMERETQSARVWDAPALVEVTPSGERLLVEPVAPGAVAKFPLNQPRDTWRWLWKDTLTRVTPFLVVAWAWARFSRGGARAVGLRRDALLEDTLLGLAIGLPLAQISALFRRWVSPGYRLPRSCSGVVSCRRWRFVVCGAFPACGDSRGRLAGRASQRSSAPTIGSAGGHGARLRASPPPEDCSARSMRRPGASRCSPRSSRMASPPPDSSTGATLPCMRSTCAACARTPGNSGLPRLRSCCASGIPSVRAADGLCAFALRALYWRQKWLRAAASRRCGERCDVTRRTPRWKARAQALC